MNDSTLRWLATTDGGSSDTPIFDQTAKDLGVLPSLATPPFRHGSGQPCGGCQSCLAEAYEMGDTNILDIPKPEEETHEEEPGPAQ